MDVKGERAGVSRESHNSGLTSVIGEEEAHRPGRNCLR